MSPRSATSADNAVLADDRRKYQPRHHLYDNDSTVKRRKLSTLTPTLSNTDFSLHSFNQSDRSTTTLTPSTDTDFSPLSKNLELIPSGRNASRQQQPQPALPLSPSPQQQQQTVASLPYSPSESFSTVTDVPADVLFRLKQFSLFSDAPESFFVKLTKALNLVQFWTQQSIVKSGEPAKSMYWILRGTVAVTSPDGESIYAELAPGSFFGEIGILFNRPRTATVIARTKVLLGVLTKDALNQVLEDYPDLEKIIRHEAQERLYMQEQRSKLSKMSTPTISQKIANVPGSLKDSNELLFENQFVDSSLIANDHDVVPGPALPPMIQNQNLSSHDLFQRNYVINPENSVTLNKSTFANIDNIDQSISIREFLCSLDIFKLLPDNIIHELALSIEVQHYRPMNYIVKKGDYGRDIYFIVYGEIEVINDSELLARLGPMMYFGEIAFLSTLYGSDNKLQPRSANIRTITDCEILMIKASKLDSICEKYPQISESFKKTAAERIQFNNVNGLNEHSVFKKINFRNTNSIIELDPFSDDNKVSAPDSTSQLEDNVFNSFSFKPKQQTEITSLSVPTLNPTKGSIQSYSFDSHNSYAGRSKFIYTPLEYRQRLFNVNRNRRRSSVINIGPFPDSVLIKILNLLNLKDLARLSLVCVRWKQLIYLSDKLMKRLDLSPWCKEMNDNKLKQIAKLVGSRPEYIDISNCYHVTDDGFTYFLQNIGIRGNIKELRMSSNWNLSAMAIMDISIYCRNLVSLDLSNCRKVKDEVLARVIGFKGNYDFGCPKLKHLKLGYCKYLTDNSLQHIKNNAHLESLDLTRCTTITDMGFQNCSSSRYLTIKKLVLKDCTFLSDKTMESISISCANLETLDLTFCCMLSDYSIKVISLGLRKLTELNLSFCGSAVSDYSLASITHLTNLEHLSIKGCVRVTREGVDMMLTQLPKLKTLNLLQCPRIDYYKGVKVDPFDKVKGRNFSCLKIKPHGRIIKVFL